MKLAPEIKHLNHLIKMVAYQAESQLLDAIAPYYARAADEGRRPSHAAFLGAADLEVTKEELRVTLRPQRSTAAS